LGPPRGKKGEREWECCTGTAMTVVAGVVVVLLLLERRMMLRWHWL
jgi:hypothetical protein